MSTRVATVRFYTGLKRLKTSPPWPTRQLPVDAVAKGLRGLTRGAGGTEAFAFDGGTLVGRLRKKTPHYAHLVFYRVRKGGYPDTFDDSTGDVAPLDLDMNKSLAEPTEMLFFMNGVIGQLVNMHGPGASSCARYVEAKTGIDFVMAPLLRDDVLEQIREDDEVSLVAVRVASSNVEQLGKAASTMRDAGLSAADAPGTGSIELIYRPAHGDKERFWDTWLPRLRRLLTRADPGTLEKVEVRRRNELGRDEYIDFLASRISAQVEVEISEYTLNVVPDIAETAIASAYNADRIAIEAALQLLTAMDIGEDDE